MMHGAKGETPVSIVENVSRAEQRVIEATLATLPEAVAQATGPAVLLYGLAARRASAALTALKEATA
jgi:uroporphyrin-III C-methyltransferase/precorrin-2 dehydrogenase/sirohydrochlorin ferrochelatase/uroporphyrin-III C-methyltransferase